jgi:hypothetical protein
VLWPALLLVAVALWNVALDVTLGDGRPSQVEGAERPAAGREARLLREVRAVTPDPGPASDRRDADGYAAARTEAPGDVLSPPRPVLHGQADDAGGFYLSQVASGLLVAARGGVTTEAVSEPAQLASGPGGGSHRSVDASAAASVGVAHAAALDTNRTAVVPAATSPVADLAVPGGAAAASGIMGAAAVSLSASKDPVPTATAALSGVSQTGQRASAGAVDASKGPGGAAEPVDTVVARSSANLRTRPGGTVLGAVRRGEVLRVHGRARGGWIQVGDGEPRGWVHGSLVAEGAR